MAEGHENRQPVHRAQPKITNVTEWAYTLHFSCVFCGRAIQRRGLLRRWRHVR